MVVTYTSIGTIRSPYKDAASVPEAPEATRHVSGEVEVDPRYASELQGIGRFSHLILVYHFHLSSIYAPEPPHNGDQPRAGLFATRSAGRVNPLGVSVVRLKKVTRNRLVVEGVDVVDGTPLLDIKPYVSAFDIRESEE